MQSIGDEADWRELGTARKPQKGRKEAPPCRAAIQLVPTVTGRRRPKRISAPAERGRDVRQQGFEDMRVIIDAELVRHGEKQRIRLCNCLVGP